MKYKAVLFDLDGTLLDTINDLANSMNNVLKSFGFPCHSIQDYKYFIGDGIYTLAHRVLPEEERNEQTIEKCVTEMKKEYGRLWANETVPYEGIPELLDNLTKEGLDMAVLSNKPDEFTKLMVSKLLSSWHFFAVCGTRPQVPLKPDPFAALQIAKDCNIPSEEFLYLGDTSTDMQTANAAGMHAVGALWGFRGKKELQENGAKTLIKHPLELLHLIR